MSTPHPALRATFSRWERIRTKHLPPPQFQPHHLRVTMSFVMDVQTARTELKSFIEAEKAAFLAKPGFGPLEETICRKVDDVVLQLWNRNGGLDVPGFALLAVGGYGRGTLHPESDLDLLLFFKDEVNETVVKNVLDPLWDLPFRVGHQIRQASDFKKFDSTHIESYAAFLDGRHLAGNAATAAEFQKIILPGFIGRNRDAFLRGLIEAKKQRYVRFGDTIFQLEPDMKDAPGGVRDFHWADWIRKTLEAPAEPNSTDVLSFHHLHAELSAFSGRGGISTRCRTNFRNRSRRSWATPNLRTAKQKRP